MVLQLNLLAHGAGVRAVPGGLPPAARLLDGPPSQEAGPVEDDRRRPRQQEQQRGQQGHSEKGQFFTGKKDTRQV